MAATIAAVGLADTDHQIRLARVGRDVEVGIVEREDVVRRDVHLAFEEPEQREHCAR